MEMIGCSFHLVSLLSRGLLNILDRNVKRYGDAVHACILGQTSTTLRSWRVISNLCQNRRHGLFSTWCCALFTSQAFHKRLICCCHCSRHPHLCVSERVHSHQKAYIVIIVLPPQITSTQAGCAHMMMLHTSCIRGLATGPSGQSDLHISKLLMCKAQYQDECWLHDTHEDCW